MNHFDPPEASERYAKGRPDFHAEAIRRIAEFLGLRQKLATALDVACGTGLSTKALLAIAETVYGTDSSEAMLRHAPLIERIQYTVATAARQPFPDNRFDIVTVCSGVHWFDIDAFLAEAKRILKNDAWLVLYDNFFTGEMDGEPDFRNWYEQYYQTAFPPPPRQDRYDWSAGHLLEKGFRLADEEQFANTVLFTSESLVLYLTTQSNVTAAVERGSTYATIENTLRQELAAFFPQGTQRTLRFGNRMHYLQNTANA